MGPFLSTHALAPHNKMVMLRGSTDISLKYFMPSSFLLLAQNHDGVKLLLLQCTP